MYPLRLTFAAVAALVLAPFVLAQDPASAQQGGAATATRGRGPALPANKPAEPRSMARHEGFLEIAKRGNIDLLFVGDSITDLWPRRGKDTWDANGCPERGQLRHLRRHHPRRALAVQNGELEGFKAKLIILMLGTNNINRNPTDEIADGDRLIIEEFKKRQPQAKVLLLGVFPRSAQATSPARATVKELNTKLAKLADNKQVFYLDIGDKFLEPDGTLSTEVMADGLHPTAKGYEIWTDAIKDKVAEMMK